MIYFAFTPGVLAALFFYLTLLVWLDLLELATDWSD